MNYSNPRMELTVTDWPSGRFQTTAIFRVETDPKRGQRVVRTTVDPKTGKPCAPKVTTYARQARIVDGDDGHTYIIELAMYGHISVMRGDMKISQEAVFETPEYVRGWNACLAGVDGRSCPYPPRTENSAQWNYGWQDCIDDGYDDPQRTEYEGADTESAYHTRPAAKALDDFIPYGPPCSAA